MLRVQFATKSTSRPSKGRGGRKASGGKTPAGAQTNAESASLTDIVSKAGSNDGM